MKPRSEVLQGTLDLMVLKTLDTPGCHAWLWYCPAHPANLAGCSVPESEHPHPALLRLEQRGWIHSEWGVSENNRKAKYYALTRDGRKQLREETADWQRMSMIINRLLETAG